MNWDSSVDAVTLPRAGQCSVSGKRRNFYFLQNIQTISGAYPAPSSTVPVALSLEIKQLGHEIDHSSLSHAEAKNEWSCTSTSPICLSGMHRLLLFYFYFNIYIFFGRGLYINYIKQVLDSGTFL
jgi:hypothetical protein